MKTHQFLMSSEECELLVEFERCGTIEKTAEALAKDPSGVSRQLSKIASLYPAVEKRQGKWILTPIGRRLNSLTRDSIQIQKQLIEDQSVLRIGTNREFGARIIGPELHRLIELFPNTQILLHTFEFGSEEALLNGRIDIGIDCQRPNDPEIAYKLILDEPIVAVAAKSFLREHKKQINNGELYSTPHLLCERLYPDKILLQTDNKINVRAMFNDIATTRSACMSGVGWALLPRYAVKQEVSEKKLTIINELTQGLAKYGVWWSRARHLNKEIVEKLCQWLALQEL